MFNFIFIILILLLVLFKSKDSCAQEKWTLIKSNEKMEKFIDSKSMQKVYDNNKIITKCWIKVVYKAPVYNEVFDKYVTVEKSLEFIDCANRKIASAEWVFYFSDETTLSIPLEDTELFKFDNVIPDSRNENIYYSVCK